MSDLHKKTYFSIHYSINIYLKNETMINAFFQKFVKICPKTGRIRSFIVPGGFYKLLFPIVGLAALIWIAIRVIPKPSRVAYPCIKAATPLASGFLAYFAILAVSAITFLKTKKKLFLSPYFLTVAICGLWFYRYLPDY